MDDDPSSYCSVVGRFESSILSLSFHLISIEEMADSESNYYLCSNNKDYALVECPSCGSWFDLDTYCPGC